MRGRSNRGRGRASWGRTNRGSASRGWASVGRDLGNVEEDDNTGSGTSGKEKPKIGFDVPDVSVNLIPAFHAGHASRQKCRDAVCDHYIVGRQCSSKFKMAAECKGACLCTEQVVELLFRDNTDLETTQSNESDSEMEEVNISDNFTQKHKELLSSWLDKMSFENENFNKTFFKQTAMEQLLQKRI